MAAANVNRQLGDDLRIDHSHRARPICGLTLDRARLLRQTVVLRQRRGIKGKLRPIHPLTHVSSRVSHQQPIRVP